MFTCDFTESKQKTNVSHESGTEVDDEIVTSLLNHWKLRHFKPIYELQNGFGKQILSVKNEMLDMCVAYSKLDIGWICNKAKAEQCCKDINTK